MATPITAIAYETANAPEAQGGTGTIDPFDLDPLYWHVESDGFGKVRILVDQTAPNSIKGVGQISEITLVYTEPIPGSPTQTMSWTDPGLDFTGNQLEMYIRVINPVTAPKAVLVLVDGVPVTNIGRNGSGPDQPFLTTLVLSSAVTGGSERAYYVNIPVFDDAVAVSATVSWTKHGGASGPIGSITVP